MKRRAFITLVGGAVSSVLARAQERVRRIGVLTGFAESDPQAQARVGAFREKLQKLGWIEGRNVQIDVRWAPNAESRQRFATELVASRPDVIVADTTTPTKAVQQETRTIPIVFFGVADPVGSGFVPSLSRPDSNMTGFTNLEPTMAGKWLELLKEMAPRLTRVALLFNPTAAPYAEYFMNPFKTAARSLSIEAVITPVRDPTELEAAIMAEAGSPNGGLAVIPDVFTAGQRELITALAARHRLPAVYPFRYFTEIGGLMSYGNDTLDMVRRTAAYADRILKGAKPAELPVQAPVKFELVINLKTARMLGLTVPQSLLSTADEVIE